ncbi:sulfatase-like hydrolase/transferase [Haladaptatus halobius]|uniref:sulfatase-like hydrolase/transferase n=1 Tax=Haladaptatus halobius TaxID=2884875 RepID=UPI001D0AD6E2|nr:sulfatase-like hydrolase/transferase [Haladaptatus halobius]
MNVLFVSIDSLRRDVLSTYDRSMDLDVATPNLDRFAERSLVFDTHYAGSLPCMPARREWMTGVQEFLWRPWGPIEPFDTTLPLAARENGVLSQLITDHFHYFQHGSDGYYEDYNGFDYVRGHEVDAWRTHPPEPEGWLLSQVLDGTPKEADDVAINELSAGNSSTDLRFQNRAQYARNAAEFEEEEDFFAPRVFSRVESWLEDNVAWDEWFCYVDSFDVHEPFHNPEPYASMYTDQDPRDPSHTVWPFYGRTDAGQSELSDDELAFVRSQFAGKVTMVDRWFGKVLNTLDDQELWDETMVVVTSDHGFFLGEHGWVGKPGRSPMYDTLVHTPLMVWHPDSPRTGGRTSALTSAVDLHATVLDAFGVDDPNRNHSRSLLPLVLDKTDHVRDWALYGYWGSSVNVTDGERTYLRSCRPENPSAVYSTTMMNAYGWFTPKTPKEDAKAGRYLPYTDAPVWRYEAPSVKRHEKPLLFDVSDDPDQTTDIAADLPEVHDEMRNLLVDALDELRAPDEQYERLGLEEVA